jgi:hypothetical protein
MIDGGTKNLMIYIGGKVNRSFYQNVRLSDVLLLQCWW